VLHGLQHGAYSLERVTRLRAPSTCCACVMLGMVRQPTQP
jgi:hypothetical protein